MKSLMKVASQTAAVAIVGVALVGPASAQDTGQAVAQDSVIETIKQRGVLKVGLSEFEPWAMRDKNGDLIGFEPDVARELAKDMEVEIELFPTAWDGIIPALISGKFDVIISGMSVTPVRNLTVNFTEPYAFSGQAILANRDLAGDMPDVESFNQADVTFAARRGTVAVEVIRELFPAAQLVLFDEEAAVVQEVVNGNAHATMSAEPLPSKEVNKYPELLFKPTDELYNASAEAFALRKGDPDAINFFNNWIAAKWRSGWLQRRHDFWFVSEDWSDQVVQ